MLPEGAARPGPFDPTLTPFMIPFQRSFTDHRYRTSVLVCSSQASKTESCMNVMGQRLDQRPVPMIYVGPTRDFVTEQLEPRFMQMLNEATTLAEKVARGKRNKLRKKLVAGVPVRLAYAGSANQLKSDPAGLVLVDERDGMEANVRGEGDPVELINARGDTYADFRIGVTSTPTEGTVETHVDPETGLEHWQVGKPEDIQSPIWRLWQEGTRYEWAWPCPHCRDYFIPRFTRLRWPKGATPSEAKREAFVECPNCGGVIEEEHKVDLNERGVYVAPGQKVRKDGRVTGDPPETSVVSFWVSGLCSPFKTFGERAERYLQAELSGETERIKAAVNTGFGELYSIGGGDAPAWEAVANSREPFRFGEIPQGGIVLTVGVDVQKTRLVYAIRAWGARYESWLIRQDELWGETSQNAVWTDLEQLIATPIDGTRIRLALVDAGYRPGEPETLPLHMVYAFARRIPNVRATKGRDTMDKPFRMTRIDVDVGGKTIKKGLELWHLNTDYFKSWVHGRLQWPEDEPGRFHIGEDASEDYCRQLVSEARIVKPSGRPTWVRRTSENHYFDCEALNAAAAHMLQVHTILPGATRPRETDAPKQSIADIAKKLNG